jgi:hypothetical protein
MNFYYPVFFGSVANALPTEADIKALGNKRVGNYLTFAAILNIADEDSCFVLPMADPIIDNFPVTMSDGLAVPCRVAVKLMPEHTSGRDLELEIIF